MKQPKIMYIVLTESTRVNMYTKSSIILWILFVLRTLKLAEDVWFSTSLRKKSNLIYQVRKDREKEHVIFSDTEERNFIWNSKFPTESQKLN